MFTKKNKIIVWSSVKPKFTTCFKFRLLCTLMKEHKKTPHVPLNPPNVPNVGAKTGGQTGSQTGEQTCAQTVCRSFHSGRRCCWRDAQENWRVAKSNAVATIDSSLLWNQHLWRWDPLGNGGSNRVLIQTRRRGSDRGLRQTRRGGSARGLRQTRRGGSAAVIDRAAMVPRGRTQARRRSETNNDAKTSFEKRLVFVICVILIDGFWLIRSFGVLLLKFELGWAGLYCFSPCLCENIYVNSSLFLAVVKL